MLPCYCRNSISIRDQYVDAEASKVSMLEYLCNGYDFMPIQCYDKKSCVIYVIIKNTVSPSQTYKA